MSSMTSSRVLETTFGDVAISRRGVMGLDLPLSRPSTWEEPAFWGVVMPASGMSTICDCDILPYDFVYFLKDITRERSGKFVGGGGGRDEVPRRQKGI